MCIAKLVATLTFLMILQTCGAVKSLHPLSTGQNLAFDPAMVGTWSTRDANGENILTFQKHGEKAYTITSPDSRDHGISKFQGRLVRLSKFLFLDVVPENPQVRPGIYSVEPDIKVGWEIGRETKCSPHFLQVGDLLFLDLIHGQQSGDGSYTLRIIKAHMFYRVRFKGGVLKLANLTEAGVHRIVNAGELTTGYERLDHWPTSNALGLGSQVVLTMPTKDLQPFVLAHATDKAVFSETLDFRRKR